MKKFSIILFAFCALALGAKAQAGYTLQQCLDSALMHNRELQNAAIEIQSAADLKKEAFTKYFPQVSANVMAFRTFDDVVRMEGTYPKEMAALASLQAVPSLAPLAGLAAYAGQPYSFDMLNRGYGATVMAIEPVYAGGKITTKNKQALLKKECMELQKSLKEKTVLQKVTENFWQIAKLKYSLRTIEAAEKQIAEVHTYVSNCVNAGVTTRNALLKVRLRQQELASNRLKVENGEHILLMLLAQQIGVSVENFNIALPEDANPQAMPAQAAASTAENREEMKLAAKNIEAEQLQTRMERAKMLPTLAVGVAGYHTALGGVGDIMGAEMKMPMTNGLAFATLSVPISELWTSNHAVRRARMRIQMARNNYLDAQEKLRIDNEVAWCNVTEAYKQIEIARASCTEAEENLRMSLNQYKAGTEKITDLLDAETLNRKSQDQLSSAIADYNIRLADYRRKTK